MLVFFKPNSDTYTTINNELLYIHNNYLYTYNSETQETIKQKLPTNKCSIKHFISCQTPLNTTIYDFNLNEIDSVLPNAIPYKDTFLYFHDSTLYLNQNNTEVEFRKNLHSNLIDYYYNKTNTYLLFKEEDFYIYNINTQETIEISLDNYNLYTEGFYFYNEELLKIYNLNTEEELEYPNHSKNNYKTSALTNNHIYYFDNNKLNILNLEHNTVQEIAENNIEDIIPFNNVILIKQNNTYKKVTLEQTEPSVSNIEEKYNLKLYLKDKAIIEFPDFLAEAEYNDETINNAIAKIETILAKLTPQFFQEFPTLNIYLTSNLIPKDYETQVATPAAYSLYYKDNYMIVIDINESNIEEIIAHELMHNLEFFLKNNNIEPFLEWNKLNPEGFSYLDSYTKDSVVDYTLTDSVDNIYFIDKYSHTYAEEDRARIFEQLLTTNNLINYPHLFAKANYLKSELIKYYPLLTNLAHY